MSLRVVGAGLGRTGTLSLKGALEKLLGGPCHHMMEVFIHQEQIPGWTAAGRGQMPDWHEFLAGYVAAVDFPAASFWPELAAANPDAIVLLSTRDSSETWWQSASSTIFKSIDLAPDPKWRDMIGAIFASRFTLDFTNREAAIAAYERHNAKVRATVPKHRLVEYQPGDGWEPLCKALHLPIPAEPFPHTNTREEWLARFASGPPAPAA
jgi:hypothetical protein